MDLGGVLDEFGYLPGHKAEERVKGREPEVAGVDGIATFFFKGLST